MPTDHFDERVAPRYDEMEADRFDPAVLDPTVEFLAELAGGGTALELGIGTGRVALPLAARGVPVSGIDLSEAMVAELRSKPGGADLDVTIGDFATTRVGTGFRLAYLVFNTISNLLTQDEQVECFRSVAAQLAPDGVFVVEVGVPKLRDLPPGRTIRTYRATPTHVDYDEYDVAAQLLRSYHLRIDGDHVDVFTTPHRFAWPAEYDLMARIAGLRLRERWADWDRSPFTSESGSHVSVWEHSPR